MNREETYAAWKNRRKHVHLDPGFADRVIQQIRRHEKPRPPTRSQPNRARRVWQTQAVAALLVVGLAAGVLRTGSVITFILLTCARGY